MIPQLSIFWKIFVIITESMQIHKVLSITLNCKGSGVNRVAAFYTKEEGKIRVFVQAPFLAVAEPFTLSRSYIISLKDSYLIKHARILQPFLKIREEEKKVHQAFFITDIIEKVAGTDYRIFNLLYNALSMIEKGSGRVLLCAFIMKLCHLAGLLPSLIKCVRCNKEVKGRLLPFSFKEGGILCSDCKRGRSYRIVESRSVRFLHTLLSLPLKSLRVDEEKGLDEAFSLCIQHLLYHIGEKPACIETFWR